MILKEEGTEEETEEEEEEEEGGDKIVEFLCVLRNNG